MKINTYDETNHLQNSVLDSTIIAFGIWYLGIFINFADWIYQNPSWLSERPAYAMGGLVGRPLLALVFFILWGWYGQKADPGAGSTYARLFKATHPANTVGCSDRDWLVIYGEGGTPPIVYKFTAVCLLIVWTSHSISYWTSSTDYEPFSWFEFARALFGAILRIVLVLWALWAGYKWLRKRIQRRQQRAESRDLAL